MVHVSLVSFNFHQKQKKHENVIMTPETTVVVANTCCFHPYLAKIPSLTIRYFSNGLVQPPTRKQGWRTFRSQQKKQSNRKISANPRIRRKSWSVIRRSITVIMWFQIQDRLQDHMGQKCLDWWKQLMLVVFLGGWNICCKKGMTSRLLSYRWGVFHHEIRIPSWANQFDGDVSAPTWLLLMVKYGKFR